MKKDWESVSHWWRAWFALTLHERMLVTAVAVILLIGATARHFYLKNQTPTAYDPPQPMERVDSPQVHIQGVKHE